MIVLKENYFMGLECCKNLCIVYACVLYLCVRVHTVKIYHWSGTFNCFVFVFVCVSACVPAFTKLRYATRVVHSTDWQRIAEDILPCPLENNIGSDLNLVIEEKFA